MPNIKSYKRSKYLFDPTSKSPYRISRSRLENFIRCPRCFYLDRRLGVDQPSMPAFTLNSAVDKLLKKEFDGYRQRREQHPLMRRYNIEAIPYAHPMLDEWRENFKGVRHHHKPTNLIIFGAIDDLWVNQQNELFVVDYKSTSTSAPITLEGGYKEAYKRQMEIYQWLLRKNNLKVSDLGYFLYCNGDKNKEAFEASLTFKLEIIPYQGNCGWVDSVIQQASDCLKSDTIPDYSKDCEYCCYRQAAAKCEIPHSQPAKKKSATVQGELFD